MNRLSGNKGVLRPLVVVVALACLGCPLSRRIQLPKELPQNFTPIVTTSDGLVVVHPLFVPADYNPEVAWPLIVCLHGAGERGLDGILPANGALAQQIRLYPERFPSLVLFAQAPYGYVWGDRQEVLVRNLPDASAILTEAIDSVVANYNIDPDRITLTGISMGGYGVYYYGADNADRFAALMPVAGAGWLDDAPKLTGLPIWAFHGDADLAVAVQDDIAMVEAVNAAGGDAWLTIFPGAKHGIWDLVYSEPAVIEWLLAQTRQPRLPGE